MILFKPSKDFERPSRDLFQTEMTRWSGDDVAHTAKVFRAHGLWMRVCASPVMGSMAFIIGRRPAFIEYLRQPVL
jgi:hypothetical protein